MIRKVLAFEKNSKVVAYFKNESQYDEFCELVSREVIDNLFNESSLRSLVMTWHYYRNLPCPDTITLFGGADNE